MQTSIDLLKYILAIHTDNFNLICKFIRIQLNENKQHVIADMIVFVKCS